MIYNIFFLCFSVSTRVNRVTMSNYKRYHSTEIPSVRLLKGRNRKLAKNGVKSFFISVYYTLFFRGINFTSICNNTDMSGSFIQMIIDDEYCFFVSFDMNV